MAQCLVEIVHLCQDAHRGDDNKDICRRMGKLIVAAQRKLDCDTKRLDRHDGHGPDGRADTEVDQRVLLAIFRRDLVYHVAGEDGDRAAKDEEACRC